MKCFKWKKCLKQFFGFRLQICTNLLSLDHLILLVYFYIYVCIIYVSLTSQPGRSQRTS